MVCAHTLVNELHPPCTYSFNGYNTYAVSTMACGSIHQKYILGHTPFTKTCFWISDWIILWSYIFLLEILWKELLWNKLQFYLRQMQHQMSQKISRCERSLKWQTQSISIKPNHKVWTPNLQVQSYFRLSLNVLWSGLAWCSVAPQYTWMYHHMQHL